MPRDPMPSYGASTESSPLGAPPSRPRLSGLALMGVGALSLLLLLVANLVWNIKQSRRDLPPEAGPVVISMQKIGELHTASFFMKDVVHQETQTEPEGWASHLPGAAQVVHWATHNQAVVIMEGRVEAGIDLSRLSEKDITQVQRSDGTKSLRVHLPPITVYTPEVKPHVDQSSSGLLWKDENIIPKAEEHARQQFLEAAEKSGIRKQAQDNAIQVLQSLQHSLGREIEFYF